MMVVSVACAGGIGLLRPLVGEVCIGSEINLRAFRDTHSLVWLLNERLLDHAFELLCLRSVDLVDGRRIHSDWYGQGDILLEGGNGLRKAVKVVLVDVASKKRCLLYTRGGGESTQ